MRRLAALILVAGLAASLAGCGLLPGNNSPSPSPSPTGHVVCCALPPVTGIVTSVDSAGLDQVHAFTLRDSRGVAWKFIVGQLDDPTVFPPGHLGEHMATAEPVKVYYREEARGHVVYRLEDAGPSASPSASATAAPSAT